MLLRRICLLLQRRREEEGKSDGPRHCIRAGIQRGRRRARDVRSLYRIHSEPWLLGGDCGGGRGGGGRASEARGGGGSHREGARAVYEVYWWW